MFLFRYFGDRSAQRRHTQLRCQPTGKDEGMEEHGLITTLVAAIVLAFVFAAALISIALIRS